MTESGTIVVLNGAPRSGKSSIVTEIQATFDGIWMNLGVDIARLTTPPRAQPGIGLRPGESSHPIASFVTVLYAALWESVAAHSRLGLNVAVDVGLHDPSVAADAARRLAGLRVLFVGVRCPLDVVLERRGEGTDAPPPVVRWQNDVHAHWTYDVEVDTSVLSPGECAETVRRRLEAVPAPSAFAELGTFLA